MPKRLQLARSIKHLGILRLLEMYKSRPGILIFNYHRIGDRFSVGSNLRELNVSLTLHAHFRTIQ